MLVKLAGDAMLNMLTFSLETCRPVSTLSIAPNLSASLLRADSKNHGLTLHSAGVVS